MRKLINFCIFFCFSSAFAEEATNISSDRLEMNTTETENIFNFYDNVELTSESLRATCDYLSITSPKDNNAKTTQIDAIDHIEAKGHVVITQLDRKATAGKAFIYPKEGKVILEDNPKVTDTKGEVSGHRIVFYKGDSKVHVEGSKEKGERPTITLRAMPELSLNQIKNETKK